MGNIKILKTSCVNNQKSFLGFRVQCDKNHICLWDRLAKDGMVSRLQVQDKLRSQWNGTLGTQ